MTIEDYSDGEYVITMGSEADALFIILSGEVVCHLGAGKEELMRQSAGSDSAFFGESCLTDAKVRGTNVVAVGPCRCAQLVRMRGRVGVRVVVATPTPNPTPNHRCARLRAEV